MGAYFRCLDVSPPLISIQAWIEASTKGGVLLFTASEIETATTAMGMSPAAGGLLGGMGGGIAQAYATMGWSSQTSQVTFSAKVQSVPFSPQDLRPV